MSSSYSQYVKNIESYESKLRILQDGFFSYITVEVLLRLSSRYLR